MPSGSGQVRPARRARRMHSPAAVALTPRLLAILRLDMPAAHGLSRSRILRMGNLGPGMPCSLWKRSEAMPIRGSPNGARHPPSTAGRDPSEWVVAINRNEWSRSIGTADRDHPVRAAWPVACYARARARRQVGWLAISHSYTRNNPAKEYPGDVHCLRYVYTLDSHHGKTGD